MQKSFAVLVLVLVMLAFAVGALAQGKKVKAPEIVKTYDLTIGDQREGPCKLVGSFTLPAPTPILIGVKAESNKLLLVRVRECPTSWTGVRGAVQLNP